MLQNENSFIHLTTAITKKYLEDKITGERTQSNEIKNVYFRFNYACVFSHGRCFRPQFINAGFDLKLRLQESHVTWLEFDGITL